MNIFRDESVEGLEQLRDYFMTRLLDAENEGSEFAINGYRWFLVMVEDEILHRMSTPMPTQEPKKKKKKRKKKAITLSCE
jgi:hypothetical protein